MEESTHASTEFLFSVVLFIGALSLWMFNYGLINNLVDASTNHMMDQDRDLVEYLDIPSVQTVKGYDVLYSFYQTRDSFNSLEVDGHLYDLRIPLEEQNFTFDLQGTYRLSQERDHVGNITKLIATSNP